MYELACCGCMWVRRRIYHNGAPAPGVMDARHRHTALYNTELYNTTLYIAILFNGVHHTLHCTRTLVGSVMADLGHRTQMLSG